MKGRRHHVGEAGDGERVTISPLVFIKSFLTNNLPPKGRA